MKELLETLVRESRALAPGGACASYIPALAAVDPGLVGLALADGEGHLFEAGDSRVRFSIQSVSKAFALAYVLEERGEDAVFSRVGKEPTGDPFNSIIRLETSRLGKPYNPMINAGAIVVASLLPEAVAGSGGASEPSARAAGLRSFVGRACGRGSGDAVTSDETVYASERGTANRNRSIAWFLKELGLLDGDVEESLEAYFLQCSMLLDAADLARAGSLLAYDGVAPWSGERLLAVRTARIVKSLMATCGLYDGSGEFGVDAGLPAKSGVGGGILAAAKRRCGIGSFGPALDPRGNSVAGTHMLKRLSAELDLFAL
ncbi:MAG: glutaminase A [Spirochaetaceae bacterium]|nr:glutaminase A [Spirochaetaceae bacterium]